MRHAVVASQSSVEGTAVQGLFAKACGSDPSEISVIELRKLLGAVSRRLAIDETSERDLVRVHDMDGSQLAALTITYHSNWEDLGKPSARQRDFPAL